MQASYGGGKTCDMQDMISLASCNMVSLEVETYNSEDENDDCKLEIDLDYHDLDSSTIMQQDAPLDLSVKEEVEVR